MNHVGGGDGATFEARNTPPQKHLAVDPEPRDNKKALSGRDKAHFKTKHVRKRKGKSDRSVAKKTLEEKGNGEGDSSVPRSLNGPNNAVNLTTEPEYESQLSSQVNEVMKEKKVPISEKTSGDSKSHMENLVNTKSKLESPVKINSAKSRQLLTNHNSDHSNLGESKGSVNQESIVSDLQSCNLYDENAIFNALCYEDKLMLQRNYIEVLKKKLEKYPMAVFHCTVCKFYGNNISVCKAHIRKSSHASDVQERRLLETVRLIPPPTPMHIRSLDRMVMKNFTKLSMGKSQRETWISAFNEVSAFVSDHFPGCSLTLYGSVATDLALKESNVDMNLQTPSSVNGPTTLAAIANALSSDTSFRDVNKDFDEGRPSVHFVHGKTGAKCCVCLSKEETLKTSEIIGKYQVIDSRFRQLAVLFRKWAKMCKIDDYKNGMWPPHTFPLLLIYYLQQVEPPVLPVLHELKGDPEDDSYLDPMDPEWKWQVSNKTTVGDLWLGLLRFYAIDYAHSDRVVCIRKKAPLKRTVKSWIGKRTAIEDPFCVKRNVSRTIIHNSSFKYIMMCFRKSYLYYGIPRTSNGHLYANIMPTYPKLEKDEEHMKRNKENSKYFLKMCKKSKLFSFGGKQSVPEEEKSQCGESGPSEESSESPVGAEKTSNSAYVITEELLLADAIFFGSHVKDDMFKYEFTAENGNKVPPTICAICSTDGHSKDQCPEANLPPLQPLPPMTDEFIRHLDEFCEFVFKDYSQTPDDVQKRKEILFVLEDFLKNHFPGARLSLFGSSSNGFGFKNSDLDICLTFKGSKSGKDINVPDLIQKLVYWLRKLPAVRNIVPIPSAKVPIVKFRHVQTWLEGDISLYNTLAQYNTQLLKAYTLIDRRVQVLGYVMKAFAKLCDICDASRGSLSSYAYILMVIYFLQQCNPPVVPVLQELSIIQPKPKVIEEGQDVWFFKDIDRLKEVWPEYGKNNLSIGALWLQMLRFYTEEFDFEQNVISIRQKEVVDKFNKLWFKKPMAIEDPFDIEHNLGGALSRKMKLFIIKSLRKGRQHYGAPIQSLPPAVKTWKEYFLTVSCLREGAPPNNGCHICKKIGHKVRNCPEKNNFSKEKRNEGERRKADNPPQGFGHQQVDHRRQPPMQGRMHGGQFWSRGGSPLVNDKLMPPPGLPPVPQIRGPSPLMNPSQEWYSQQWRHLQVRRTMGAPMMMRPSPRMMPGMVMPCDPMAMVNSMPTCAAVERDMARGNMEMGHNSVFRKTDVAAQRYRDPCISLSNYRKQVSADDSMRNVAQGENQNFYGGAIPKVGPNIGPMRHRFSKVQNVHNNNEPKA